MIPENTTTSKAMKPKKNRTRGQSLKAGESTEFVQGNAIRHKHKLDQPPTNKQRK